MKYYLFLVLCLLILPVQSQIFFQSEVNKIQERYKNEINNNTNYIVFTGSSSIRMWKDLPVLFENSKIINTGFGGSKASDLLYYIKELVLDFNPSKVIIYEGDNDISSGHKINFIMKNIKQIIKQIKEINKNAQIILISAKPSIMRWDLRKKYIQLNKKYKNLALKNKNIHFADTWSQMVDSGKLKTDIFIEDGLHLNKKGYKIWERVLRPILNNTD